MLNAMREGAKSGVIKFILFGFLVMAVFGLVLTDVGGFFRGGVTRTSVAKIEGHEIPVVAFDRTLRRVLAQQNMDAASAYQMGLVKQVLRSEITNYVMQKAAYDLGLQISEQTIADNIARLVQPYVTDGMTSQQAFEGILRSQGMTEREFIRTFRAEMANTMLRNTFQIGANNPSEKEALQMYQHNMETREVEYVYVPHSAMTNILAATDEVLLPFYQAGKERYAIPETRSFTLAILDPKKMQDTITVTEEEVRSAYDRDIDSYTLPERRTLAQAIFSEQSVAGDVAKRTKDGQTLEDAVKSVTGDTAAYLGEQEFEKNGLTEEIATPAFEEEVGFVSDPIETALGWHVVVIKDALDSRPQSFDEIKKDLREALLADKATDDLFDMANQIDDQLAGGIALEEIAETTSLTLETYKDLRADGSKLNATEGFEGYEDDRAYLLETAFELLEGETAPVVELADGRFATLRVDSITEKTYKPFEDIKDDLKTVWNNDQREVENRLQAIEAVQGINNGESSLADYANKFGRSIQKTTINRKDDPASPLTVNSKNILLNISEGGYTLAPAEDGYIVAKIAKIELPDTANANDETLTEIKKQQANNLRQEIFQMYMVSLDSKYDVKVNERLLEQTYGPGAEASY